MWLALAAASGIGFLSTVWIVYFLKMYPGYFALSFPSLPFWRALSLALSGRSDAVPWSEIISTALRSALITVSSLALGVLLSVVFILLSDRTGMNISPKLSALAFIPEIFMLVYAWIFLDVSRILKSRYHQMIAGALIVSFVTLRSLGEFSKYMWGSYVDYASGVTYYVFRIRRVRGRWMYLSKNVVFDSLSTMIFEVPLMMSYLAVMERSLDFYGISRSFFNAMVYGGNAPLLMRRAAVISIILVAVQISLHALMGVMDKRRGSV